MKQIPDRIQSLAGRLALATIALAPLDRLVQIAARSGALLFMDDSHGVGVCGKTGRGTPEAKGVHGQIDVLTGTLGKAMGGAAGGYISGRKS